MELGSLMGWGGETAMCVYSSKLDDRLGLMEGLCRLENIFLSSGEGSIPFQYSGKLPLPNEEMYQYFPRGCRNLLSRLV